MAFQSQWREPSGIQSVYERNATMHTKLHIGNVASTTTQADLRDLFSQQGLVLDVKLVLNRGAGRSRGFAFVTMATNEGAKAALAALNGELLGGRFITVSESRSHEDGSVQSECWDRVPRRSYRKLY